MASHVKYSIKDNFTMPPVKRAGRPAIYPFAGMKVGQTAIFDDIKSGRQLTRLRGAVSAYAQRHGIRLSTRYLKDSAQFAVQRLRAVSA